MMDIEMKVQKISETLAYNYADFMIKQLHESELEYDTMLRMLQGISEDAMNELLIYIDRKQNNER